MTTAIWIIAICEIIRTLQVTADIIITMNSRKTVNNAFIDSLKQDNREWTEDLLKEFLKSKGSDYFYSKNECNCDSCKYADLSCEDAPCEDCTMSGNNNHYERAEK